MRSSSDMVAVTGRYGLIRVAQGTHSAVSRKHKGKRVKTVIETLCVNISRLASGVAFTLIARRRRFFALKAQICGSLAKCRQGLF